MRTILMTSILLSFWWITTTFAESANKWEWAGSVQHTPHPPHDHHHDDHVKKLDESLKRSREDWENDEDREDLLNLD